MVGRRARCAACNAAFTVPAPTNSEGPPAIAPAKPPEAPTEAPEHIGFECRVCGTRMYGRSNQVGKKLKCGDCGALSEVPPPPKPKRTNMPAALEGEQYELWEPDDQPLPSQILAAQPKLIAVKCRRCDTMMYPTDREVGQEIACPDCGTKHLVPPPPKPVVRPSVLASDATTPLLDPAAHPGERPHVLPPSRKMMHEERAEAEYARALEKSKRTGKPMEIDIHGRPVLPRWPLVSGILPFLFSSGVPIAWIALSIGFFMSGHVLLFGLGMAMMGGFAAIGGMCIFAMGCVMTMLCASALFSIMLQTIMESSMGNRHIQDWPSFLDWFGNLIYVGVAYATSAIPGYAIAQIPPLNSEPGMAALLCAVSVVLCLPIVMLSQLEINSPWGLLSGRILTSMARCPFSWAFFYLECLILAAICGAATYFFADLNPAAALWLTPLYVAVLILFARLLGRLAWRLADATTSDAK
jgi:DNA-directed RNA polymerase subunit M/transcription elongation factor TFIIS